MKRTVTYSPLAVFLWLCVGIAIGLLLHLDEPKSRMIGQTPDAFTLPALGDANARFSPADWKGKVTVLNIFASWCASCVSEHKFLMRLADSKKAHMVGIGWRDEPEKLAKWLDLYGNPFAKVGVDEERRTTVILGLTGVPETFIFDKRGVIVYNRKMPIIEDELDDVILPLLERLQHE